MDKLNVFIKFVLSLISIMGVIYEAHIEATLDRDPNRYLYLILAGVAFGLSGKEITEVILSYFNKKNGGTG
jgi:hypothetical protein